MRSYSLYVRNTNRWSGRPPSYYVTLQTYPIVDEGIIASDLLDILPVYGNIKMESWGEYFSSTNLIYTDSSYIKVKNVHDFIGVLIN